MVLSELVWYVAVADSVVKAENSLKALGHTVICPRAKYFAGIGLNRQKHTRTLLYKYLFIGMQSGSSMHEISTARGVHHILGDEDGNPRSVPAEAIMRFVTGEQMGEFDRTTKEPIKPGTSVRVTSGPFNWMYGKILKCKRHAIAWIEMDVMGAKRRVNIPLMYLEIV